MIRPFALRTDEHRRAFIRRFGAAAGLVLTCEGALRWSGAQTAPAEYPFTLGVASGDPAPDGFVIWTRLVPRPFEIGFGMPGAPVEVGWEVASDEGFTTIVRSGAAIASPQLAHSVHVEIEGLEPGRPYWYRFRSGGHASPVGRSKTAPAPDGRPERVRFAVAGCQSYEAGLFTAHRYLAAEDLDFVFCYGDYIYENAGRPQPHPSPDMKDRVHFGSEIYSVDDYRRRYAQYRMDPDLRAAHAAHPWFVVWDDHETDNNWASAFDEKNTPAHIFALRRQAAVQAYYEHMPLRMSAFPAGVAIQLYRRARYGRVLDLHLLDTRQYRSNQPCNDVSAGCRDVNAADATFLGDAQERWLLGGLSQSTAVWKTLAQQMMMMDLDRDPGPEIRYNIDSWAGYRRPRERVLRHIRDRRISDVVVLTGDEHVNYAGDLHIDGSDPGRRAIANEFVATSISSGGDGQDVSPNAAGVLSVNPQLKFINTQRGFLVCEATEKAWTTEFRVIDRVTSRGGTMTLRKRFTIERGSAELSES